MKFFLRKAQRKAKRQEKKEKKNKHYKKITENEPIEESEEEKIVTKKVKPEKKQKKEPKFSDDVKYLDAEIEELERKLGVKSSNSKESDKNRKKLRNQLELDGFGADFYEFLEGKAFKEEDEISVEGLKEGEESPEISLVSGGENFEEDEENLDSEDEMNSEDAEESQEENMENEEEFDEDEEEIEEEEEEMEEEEEGNDSDESQENPRKIQKINEEQNDSKYIPPALRAVDTTKKFKGLLNRISDQNIEPITTQIAELYKTESMNILNDNLWEFLESSVNSSNMPPQLLAVYSAEISALGRFIGREIPAFILDKLFTCLSLNSKSYLSVWGYLYYFDVIGSAIITGLVRYLTGNLSEETLDLLIVLFNLIGFKLRKDEPGELKKIIDEIREKGKNLKSDGKRMSFMLETLTNIKNNKKMINQTEDRLKFLKTWLKKTVGKKSNAKDAKITARWEDLGSSNWRSLLQPTFEFSKKSSSIDPELEKLAQSQHMNTDNRRQIFSLIMSSEDYMDAFAKVSKLKKQERDIVRVIITCCGQELAYNQFYALLASQLCTDKPSYKYSFQYALWDNLKQLHEFSIRKISNIAKLYSYMIKTESIGLGCLKAVDFDKLNDNFSLFLRILLENILLADESIVAKIFYKVGSNEKLKALAEGLKVFLKFAILNHPRKGFIEQLGNENIFKEKIKAARDVLKGIS